MEKSVLALVITRDTLTFLVLIGNVFSFLVYSKKAFASTSIQIYACALAIADSFVAIQLIVDIFKIYIKYDLTTTSQLACKLIFYFGEWLSTIPGWILVLFSLDTAVSIMVIERNKFTNFIKHTKFKISLILMVTLINACMFTFVPINLEIENSTAMDSNVTSLVCDLRKLPNANLFALFYLIDANLFPFGIIMITTGLLWNFLHKSGKNLTISKPRKDRDRKLAVNSIAINVIYLVWSSPVVISYIFPIAERSSTHLVDGITTILYTMNFLSHFLTHLIFNSLFRKEFLKMIGIPKIK